MLAEPVTAEQAQAWGMIWQAVDDADLMREAGRSLPGSPPCRPGPGRDPQALDGAATNSLDAQLDLERDLQAELGRGDDYPEGVRAFLEKRPPSFGPRRAPE